nr:hypothetical protein [Dietzia sp. JS16-p6b]
MYLEHHPVDLVDDPDGHVRAARVLPGVRHSLLGHPEHRDIDEGGQGVRIADVLDGDPVAEGPRRPGQVVQRRHSRHRGQSVAAPGLPGVRGVPGVLGVLGVLAQESDHLPQVVEGLAPLVPQPHRPGPRGVGVAVDESFHGRRLHHHRRQVVRGDVVQLAGQTGPLLGDGRPHPGIPVPLEPVRPLLHEPQVVPSRREVHPEQHRGDPHRHRGEHVLDGDADPRAAGEGDRRDRRGLRPGRGGGHP